ncbi:MAG TPA: hypothetical protein VL485_26225 [Ktedonobacteraceae bacterium]|jgi:hypothetical protein|nr:hypothetical protein [Ktedonobacteraceae bacterium]
MTDKKMKLTGFLHTERRQIQGCSKAIYCCTITNLALRLIRSFDGDVLNNEAIICNFASEEPSRDQWGQLVDGAFRIYFPNQQAICYTLSGEISFVL